ncbi:tight adherence protein B [Rhizobium sp. RU20A]|uniref:type II secretion system F family protein n=1 Tax=Rhizobium sp. RU20A TaxID=1907412 RepID=UPI000955C101|nr:type II secretion system F family protein [Rhizobium sp. RU20A]SIQ77398.1 tight adherence protein B [Rhizobium sp. RU20A]
MFGVSPAILMIVLLAAVAAGSMAYVFLFSRLEVEKKAENRMRRVSTAETDRTKIKAARERVAELSKRRKSVQDSLRELEKKQEEKSKRRREDAKTLLMRADVPMTVPQFYMASSGLGLCIFLAVFILSNDLLVAAGTFVVGALGAPRFVLSFLFKRRCKKFLDEFPNSLDVMVRSIKSGLPLSDALKLIATEGREPVKTEFRKVVESQQVGMSIPEACARMYQSIPLPEISFFAIVIAIQSQAGGNLSEALSNLSKVLRDRRKMKAKVQALSMEAKASAVIIGALPFIVATLVYLTSPSYIMILFTDWRGHVILACSAVWMGIGVLVMRNMINFDI